MEDSKRALGDATKSFGMQYANSKGAVDSAAQFGQATLRGLEALYKLQKSVEILDRVEPLAKDTRTQ